MEPFVPRLLLVADTASQSEQRLKQELSAAGLPLLHCRSLVEASEICGSLHFDCAIVDEATGSTPGAAQSASFERLPRILLTAEAPAADGAVDSSDSLSWPEVNVARLMDAVRGVLDRRGSSSQNGPTDSWRASRSPSTAARAEAEELRGAFEDLGRHFARVEGVFEGIRTLSSLEQDEALVEVAVFAQQHEECIAAVWAALERCNRALQRLRAQGAADTDPVPGQWTLPDPDGGDSQTLVRPETSQPPPPSARPEESTLRVLIVDDEPAVLRAFRRVLQPDYDVATARDGSEALAFALGQPLDAVVCDLTMPKLDGLAFFDELTELKPELTSRVIFCTGGVPNDRILRFLRALPNPVLRKPVDARDLIGTIRRISGRGPLAE